MNELIKFYQNKEASNQDAKIRLRRKLTWLSVFRAISFLLIFLSGALIIPDYPIIGILVAMMVSAIFGYFVKFYFNTSYEFKYTENLISICQNELKALAYDFYEFYPGNEYINQNHPYANDLDLFGEGSVFQFLNRTITMLGRNQLANWLTNTICDKERLQHFQQGIKDVCEEPTLRHHFIATGMIASISDKDNKGLLKWINGENLFYGKIIFQILRILLPLATILSLVAGFYGLISFTAFMGLVITQLLFVGIYIRRVNRHHAELGNEFSVLRNYYRLLRIIGKAEFKSPLLGEIKEQLVSGKKSASRSVKRLSIILNSFDNRLNIIVGLLLNGILLWDLQCVLQLEKWKKDNQENLKSWLNAIGKFDGLCSMGNYSFNNPEYCLPTISQETVISARNLGHPLINSTNRVDNDFEIDAEGKFVIITGANMSGKSTFLRAVGVNLVLARMGMPVCASSFSFKLLNIFSSMRTTDSLDKNESYFYAELKRLQFIVQKLNNGESLFVLLDEILKGTNSEDKAKGSQKFLEYILQLKATGIIATHDLSLAQYGEKMAPKLRNQCFEIDIDGENIFFDYKLKDGVTQNMNALMLMKQMGILSPK